MSRKKINLRIKRLIQNSVAARHRSIFFVLGEKSKEQLVYLYHLLLKCRANFFPEKPSVVWFFKKDLGFNMYQEKRLKQLKKKYAGNYVLNTEDLFDHFLFATNVQFCHYSETERMLGQTFGVLIIQDFQALTPNTIARIVECVEGGGMIIFLLSSVESLDDLFSLKMDSHSRYVTEAFPEVSPRFNKRFVLSLASCSNCLVLDDKLHIKLLPDNFDTIHEAPQIKVNTEVNRTSDFKPCLSNNLSKVLTVCCTSDQSAALLTLNDALNNRYVFNIVSMTSGRGRGKSSLLGLALSLALTSTYSNVYITSPHLENLQTLFSFLVKGLTTLDCVEGTDYKVLRTETNFMNLISGIRVLRENVRTVTYLSPIDAHKLGSADLVVLDEAAAIPLPLVKKWIGSYTVFIASTINGYEGTGRSLSLKLISQLSSQCSQPIKNDDKLAASNDKGHVLHEIQLNEAIRYANGDEVERWLNHLLCLEATITNHIQSTPPEPELCDLYYVDMSVLFGYNKAAEKFLQQMISLFVSSHYKNSPNDLMMMADAPAHQVFCLLPPVNPDSNVLPIVLCAIQIAQEGRISEENVSAEHSHGRRASGDLIPWIISQQFQDNGFCSLAGARIVRIATHPDYQRMGYGQRALELLSSFYSTSSEQNHSKKIIITAKESQKLSLLTKLTEMSHGPIDYLGVSYGLTTELFKFWKKCGFIPIYIRQTTSETTGEHSCIMIKNLEPHNRWLEDYFSDFTQRFLSLLTSPFKELPVSLVREILHAKHLEVQKELSPEVSRWFFSSRSLERLKAYHQHQVDYHLTMDLLPVLSRFYFLGCLDNFTLPQIQESVLICIGLQNKSVNVTALEVGAEHNEVMGYLRKATERIVKKLHSESLLSIESNRIEQTNTGEKLQLTTKRKSVPSAGTQNKKVDYSQNNSKKSKLVKEGWLAK